MSATPEKDPAIQPVMAPAANEETMSEESAALDEALQEAGAGATYSRGEALTGREAAAIAVERRATVVILAGSSGSGKTTLLASLYERFGRGPMAGHLFDGSRTLHGFELRCHRSIHGEGPGTAAQGHTSIAALPWLHLRTIRDDDPSRVIELLLGDYSGERFEALAKGAEAPSDFPELRRADHLCLVLDGAALADPADGQAEQREALELLRVLLRTPAAIADPSVISFVVAKWDLIQAGGSEAREAVERTWAVLRDEIGESAPGAAVGYLETAARSTIPELPLGHGVDDLLTRFTDRPFVRIANPPVSVAQASSRQLDRYQFVDEWEEAR
jgi:hypothetical protein